jgi:hypothetical protein
MYRSETAIKSCFVFSMLIILFCLIDNTVQGASFECFAAGDLVRSFPILSQPALRYRRSCNQYELEKSSEMVWKTMSTLWSSKNLQIETP